MLGYFNDKEKEYIITQMKPRRPLENYLWNENFLLDINHFGFGESFLRLEGNDRRQLFTETEATRLVYVKDKNTGEFYDANRNYQNKVFDEHLCHVGIGYQCITSEYKGIKVEYCITVPESGNVELWQIRILNRCDETKELGIISYSRPDANVTKHWAYGYADYNNDLEGLYFCHDAFNIGHNYSGIFVKSDIKPNSYDVSDIYFKGYNEWGTPEALYNEQLSNNGISFDNHYCAALRFDLSLKPGEQKIINIVAGISTNIEDAKACCNKYLSNGYFENNIKNIKKEFEKIDSIYTVNTPDVYINSMVNIWLKRQISLGKTWGRVYSKGFRDIMQDIAAFVSFSPEVAKTKIVYCLEHQRYNGNPLRAFEPVNNELYYDGATWIPATILAYVKESGDISILDVPCKYYDNDVKETVFEHTLRGIRFLLENRGNRNMVLWGGGDWNDSINNTGNKFKGESVWLSIATVKAVTEFCELLSYTGKYNELILKLNEEKEILKKAIISNGFECDRFIYGINDWNEKLGSKDCTDGEIYLNPQTWAILADILDEDSSKKLMQTVEEKLKCEYGYVQCFPAYSNKDEHIGRMAYFMPGCYENGSVYNHGVTFKIAADCKLRKGDAAFETLKLISYDNPKNDNSGVEPYVVSNMYLGPQDKYRPGYAPCSWITGTAGWLYRNLTESILGISAEFNGLKINPCLPSHWENVSISRIYRGAIYDISIQKAGEKKTIVDGKEQKDNIVKIFKKGTRHTIVCQV